MIATVIYIAMLAAFSILLATKTGGVEWLQVHGGRWLSEMACCTFCLSWWTCVAISVIWCIATTDITILFVPFIATPITRFLI